MSSLALDVIGNLTFLLTTRACMVRDMIKLRKLLDSNCSMRNEFNAIMTGELAR